MGIAQSEVKFFDGKLSSAKLLALQNIHGFAETINIKHHINESKEINQLLDSNVAIIKTKKYQYFLRFILTKQRKSDIIIVQGNLYFRYNGNYEGFVGTPG